MKNDWSSGKKKKGVAAVLEPPLAFHNTPCCSWSWQQRQSQFQKKSKKRKNKRNASLQTFVLNLFSFLINIKTKPKNKENDLTVLLSNSTVMKPRQWWNQLLLFNVTPEIVLVHLVKPPVEKHFFQSRCNFSLDSVTKQLASQITKQGGRRDVELWQKSRNWLIQLKKRQKWRQLTVLSRCSNCVTLFLSQILQLNVMVCQRLLAWTVGATTESPHALICAVQLMMSCC